MLVYNGEIYNFKVLRNEVEKADFGFQISESERRKADSGKSSQQARSGGAGQYAVGGDAEDVANSKSLTSDIKKWRSHSDTEVLLRLYLHCKKTEKPFGEMLKT